MAKQRCKGTTKAGSRCSKWPLHGKAHCFSHDKESQDSGRFGGPQPGSGAPRKPRVIEEMRRQVEAQADAILAPFFEAIEGAMMSANHQGEVTMSKFPDLEARQRAAERLLDRVYGKPAQAVELTGAAGGAVAAQLMVVDDFDAETRQLAHDLLARAAGRERTVG